MIPLAASDYVFRCSVRRIRCLAECPRNYFLQYYAARGGHESEAEPQLRKLHLLRSLLSVSEYFHVLLRNTLHESFYYDLPDSALAAMLLKRMNRDFNFMLRRESEVDHGRPMLMELYYGETSPGNLHAQLSDRLQNAAGNIVKGGEWRRIQQLDSVQRKFFLAVPEVRIGGIPCCFSPVAMVMDHGRLVVVELSSSEPDLRRILHCYYALNPLRISPERVHSVYLSMVDGCLNRLAEPFIPSRTLERLMNAVEQMKTFIRPDGIVAMEDFATNPERCGSCKFREFCGV